MSNKMAGWSTGGAGGGAIDMKIYSDESPLDLAVRTDLQPPAMTSLIVETLDKVSTES